MTKRAWRLIETSARDRHPEATGIRKTYIARSRDGRFHIKITGPDSVEESFDTVDFAAGFIEKLEQPIRADFAAILAGVRGYEPLVRRLCNWGLCNADLVFQLWSAEFGIFFDRSTYEELAQIDSALSQSRTWGEFRAALPEGEFESLTLWSINDGEYVYRDGDEYLYIADDELQDFLEYYDENYVKSPEDAFSPDQVPGYEDGDYPPWLYSTAENLLPPDFIEEFGHAAMSMVSGSWWEFPEDRLEEMTEFLEKAGFSVTANRSFDV